MGALPGTQPVTRPSSTSTGQPRRPRTQPPSLSPSTRLPTKPSLAARKAASSASARAGPARRSLLAPSRPTPATPIQASPRRSMLATPVKATPRRSMLATPTFSRPKPTAGLTPATLAKSTPVIKSHLSVGKSQLRPRGLGAQPSTLTPRAPPLTGPRPLVSRAWPSKVVPVARPKRRISGLPSPLPSSGKIPS
ncbi:uncharacterized protein DKFZp434B061-like [Tigriopus californicus]|uniref:uncharacterized protein DKFZp434B061-like n=1 Tax=Tigriopus californicus TaxID=6832 RepID=UPI0027DA255C|nr:uncharacterized protein DKFZp434B061-like [Tigriopus californicus]